MKRLRAPKIVLSIHSYDDPGAQFADFARLDHLLANRCFVVHERPADVVADPAFSAHVTTCRYEELADTCVKFLAAPAERKRIAEGAYEWFKAERSLDDFIPYEDNPRVARATDVARGRTSAWSLVESSARPGRSSRRRRVFGRGDRHDNWSISLGQCGVHARRSRTCKHFTSSHRAAPCDRHHGENVVRGRRRPPAAVRSPLPWLRRSRSTRWVRRAGPRQSRSSSRSAANRCTVRRKFGPRPP